MRRLVFLSVFLIAQQSMAQVKSNNVTAAQLPKGMKFEGKFVKAIRFTDAGGEHLVLATETGETQSKANSDGDYREAALHVYEFKQSNGAWVKGWVVNDFVKECPVDITAAFIKNAIRVTDLDNNGEAEVWLMYKTACHGDVSPSDLKVIMYEAGKKYAMRGQSLVKMPGGEAEGGNYVFDGAFNTGAKVFKQFAQKLWNNYKLEDFK
ncbi:M949_RS01915 family surface polysaccharide biosynthesis protein [Mucilaginibacter defluvii]